MPVTSWGTVKVPKQLLEKIDKIAKQEGVPRHVIVSRALASLLSSQEKVGGTIYLKGRKHPRNYWYAWKFLLSYAEFRVSIKYRKCIPHTVRTKMLKFFEGNLWQLRERLKLLTPEEAKEVFKLAKEYMETQSNSTLYRLNDTIRDIFFRILGGV